MKDEYQTQRYTPLTFLENTKKYGFAEALKTDLSVLVERSPVLDILARANKWGVELVRDRNSHYDYVMSKAETKIGKKSLGLLRRPIKLLNVMDYPIGVLEVLCGIKSGQTGETK